MTVLESISNTEVVFLPYLITGINENVEIEIDGFLIKGDVTIKGNYESEDWENFIPASFEITSQELTVLEIYDTELCSDINFSKKDQNIINDWFQNLELEVKTN